MVLREALETGELTDDEVAEGWHFCPELDYELLQCRGCVAEHCGFLEFGQGDRYFGIDESFELPDEKFEAD